MPGDDVCWICLDDEPPRAHNPPDCTCMSSGAVHAKCLRDLVRAPATPITTEMRDGNVFLLVLHGVCNRHMRFPVVLLTHWEFVYVLMHAGLYYARDLMRTRADRLRGVAVAVALLCILISATGRFAGAIAAFASLVIALPFADDERVHPKRFELAIFVAWTLLVLAPGVPMGACNAFIIIAYTRVALARMSVQLAVAYARQRALVAVGDE
jgi:hypothetical protein